jgi:hypothetical protein
VADESSEDKRKRQQREEELAQHNRQVARDAAHASRDVLHDSAPDTEPGAYTTHEARDRAAHTPAWVKSAEGQGAPSPFTAEEQRLFAEQKRDMAEIYPTEEAYQRSYPPLKPPADPAERQQYDDFKQMYPPVEPAKKEGLPDVTPEQKAEVDKTLANTTLAKETIGSAIDGPPPPTPMENVKDIGQDLHNEGVRHDKTFDKE